MATARFILNAEVHMNHMENHRERPVLQGRTVTEKILLRPEEVADVLGFGRSKIYQLISARALPSVRIGKSVRVPYAALRDWVERQLRCQ